MKISHIILSFIVGCSFSQNKSFQIPSCNGIKKTRVYSEAEILWDCGEIPWVFSDGEYITPKICTKKNDSVNIVTIPNINTTKNSDKEQIWYFFEKIKNIK